LQLYLVADFETKTLNLEQMKIEEQNLNEAESPQLNIGAVSGSYIWLVEDCDGSCILSAHLTEDEAEKERELLRGGYAPCVDFRVYSVQIS
jgi:hypothetical protein